MSAATCASPRRPNSSLADCILQLWRAGRLAEFARLLPKQARAESGNGLCSVITLSFLTAAGDLPVEGRWARTPVGWHSYVVMSGEAFDVLPCEDAALVVVQLHEEFMRDRGIGWEVPSGD
ncbi:MAG TPA: hypothetical protein VFZ04_00250 [Longimicrobiales bacterium]